ncbi:uncharacterized protein LOC135102946 [Scylla paramamosain]|uniref:uncharacterized protein LOC135102946 n=1 Tax=Scylla paramamosain TaxID=85552 RepID=UPI00308272F9
MVEIACTMHSQSQAHALSGTLKVLGTAQAAAMVETLPEGLLPSAVFGPPSSSSQEKMVTEVSSPQVGMLLGVVLGSLLVLGLAVQMFVGFLKMRWHVILHTHFLNPVHHKTAGIKDRSNYSIEHYIPLAGL